MTGNTFDFESFDWAKALNDGIKDDLAEFPGRGAPERFRRPGEYVAPVRTHPVERACLSVEEFIELSRMRDHSHR